jgi:GNAT superfamily N-acetyltransferase
VKLYGALPAAEPAIAELAARGVRVRRALPIDAPGIAAWLAARPEFPVGWRGEVGAALARQPPGCFVATDASNAPGGLGYVTTPEPLLGFACWDATAKGFFGPEGVIASHRGRGIGRALLLASLHAMRADGYGYAVIGWAGAVEFYRRTVGAIEIPGSEPGIYPPPLE